MARLIDVNDVYSLFDKSGFAKLHVTDIDQIPIVDAVEVVRCRECKFGDWDSEPNDAMVCMRTKDGFWRSGNDFCSFGERKDGVDNGEA